MRFTDHEQRMIDSFSPHLGKNAPGIDLTAVIERIIKEIPREHFSEVELAPLSTLNLYWIAPEDLVLTEVKLLAITAPASATGTYTLAVDAGGVNMLATTTFDLESLVDDTVVSLSLSSVLGALKVAKDTKITMTFTSNASDLTGAGLHIQLVAEGG